MSKPTELPRWGTALANPSDIVDPPSGKKDIGWQDGEMPPHSYFNWFMNLVYLWAAYLNGLTGEALTWTALQTFSAGIVVTGGATIDTLTLASLAISGNALIGGTLGVTGATTLQGGATVTTSSGIALSATATGANPAIQGTSSTTAGSFGVTGIGANGGATGRGGIFGHGGLGSTVGGDGITGAGGDGNGAGANGGNGGSFIGGNAGATGSCHGGTGAVFTGGFVNGATNSVARAGTGLTALGGTVISDVNGRVGGVGLIAIGGTGQAAGTGHAIEATGDVVVGSGILHLLTGCDIDLDNGNIVQSNGSQNILISTQIDGNLSVVGTSLFTGLTTLTQENEQFVGVGGAPAFQNSWVNETTSGQTHLKFFKDSQGMVHVNGQVKSGSGAVVCTLPVGYRPAADYLLPSIADFGSGYVGTILTVRSNGNVETSGNHAVLDAHFRAV